MQLFETLDDLKPFIFRITDNGGASGDRYTVITCDGDYFAMSATPFHPQGIGLTGEGLDVAGIAERVEAGTERDIRWIDLPEDCQRCVWDGLNRGFADYLALAPAAASRAEAFEYEGWSDWDYRTRRAGDKGPSLPIYRDGDAFKVRRYGDGSDDECFATWREAFLYLLPDESDLAGEEYHGTRDLWNVEGGPVEPWDCEAEPPTAED